MHLIPLGAIINSVVMIVAFVCAYIIWLHNIERLRQNQFASRATIGFIMAGFLYAIWGLPIAFSDDGRLFQAARLIGTAWLFCLNAYIIFIPLTLFSENKKVAIVIAAVLVCYAVYYLVYTLSHLEAAKIIPVGPFSVWQRPPTPTSIFWTQTILSFSGVIAFIIMFIRKGWFNKDPFIRTRSRVICLGFTIIFIGIALYIISPAAHNLILYISLAIASGIFNIFGFLLLLDGVLMEQKNKESQI